MTDPVDEDASAPPEDDEIDEDDEYDDDYDEWYRRRRRIRILVAAGAIVLAGLGVGLGFGLSGSSPSLGPEQVSLQPPPDLASADSTVHGTPVDGFITCRPQMDQGIAYHIHTRLDVFVNGVLERLPAGAGIDAPRDQFSLPGGTFTDQSPTSCLYWLHVHTTDGIIHVEAPHQQTFTLGEFFDVWGQPLGPDQVGPAHGPVVVFENGKQLDVNPRDVPLLPQAVIQLDVGTPVVPFKPWYFGKVGGPCGATCSVPTT